MSTPRHRIAGVLPPHTLGKFRQGSASTAALAGVVALALCVVGAIVFVSVRFGRSKEARGLVAFVQVESVPHASTPQHRRALSLQDLAGADGAAWAAPAASGGSGAVSPPPPPPPSVCVVARTFHAQKRQLLAFVSSLATAAPPGLSIVFVDTDRHTPFADLPEVAAALNSLVFGDAGREVVTVSPRTRRANATAGAFPAFVAEDHGYILTDLVLEDLLHARRAASDAGSAAPGCEWLLVTNGDNLYHAQFFRATLEAAAGTGTGAGTDGGADLVATHFVSHYDWPGSPLQEPLWEKVRLFGQCGPWRPGRDVEVAVNWKPACVDLGAVLVRAAALEASGARFLVDRLRAGDPAGGKGVNAMEADGELFRRLAGTPGVRSVIVRRALMVHQ